MSEKKDDTPKREVQGQLGSAVKTGKKKPKNLQQGLLSGASNIVGGAVGGLGVAVFAPAVGFKAGAQRGGIVGASVGLVSGAAVG